MINLKDNVTIINLINLTGETIRDIVITYAGDKIPIEVLKIKNDYEKTVFLNVDDIDDLVNLKMIYKEKEYIIYKNIDVNSEVNIKLKILKEESGEVNIKSYLFIK
ncbi:hypothetical protein [uncultured Clostridium sp.]|uniref:hypothetical protein n=1 Tax=uncultured Clostridium sp. TaxID=59620 RepID=UPI00261FB503|nr:hypothetical protein [uncultured Clostridium sp.]